MKPPVPKVIECSVTAPSAVRLRFHDGFVGTIDLAPMLCGPIFGALKRAEKFRQVAVQDGTLVWPNGADICPSVLRYWSEIGHVCSQEELDAHFAEDQSPARKVAETPAKYTARRKK